MIGLAWLYLAALTLGALWLMRERRALISRVRHLERIVAAFRRQRISDRALPGAASLDDLLGRYRDRSSVPSVGPRRADR